MITKVLSAVIAISLFVFTAGCGTDKSTPPDPDSSGPETTEPISTGPETTEPGATEPEVTPDELPEVEEEDPAPPPVLKE